eukprot:2243790-Pleurochrysis_carterae.AAC.1
MHARTCAHARARLRVAKRAIGCHHTPSHTPCLLAGTRTLHTLTAALASLLLGIRSLLHFPARAETNTFGFRSQC